MKKLLTVLSVLTIYSSVSASELTFGFKSPSFNGVGQSSHYLTIENIEKTRKDALIAKKKADAKALKDEINGTAVAKFKANLEARFYTALAKQLQTTYSVLMVFNKIQEHLQVQMVKRLLGQLLEVRVT